MRTTDTILSKNTLLLVCVILGLTGTSYAAEYFLRADTTTKTMPDGQVVVMWGFAADSAFGANDGTVTVPGPVLTVPANQGNLIVNLDNNLPVPVSIVIPGQIKTTVPVKFVDAKGRQRIRAFTMETPPNNTEPVVYKWKDIKSGTYLYHSGSHPAVQVQMGLYGCMRQDLEKPKQVNALGIAYAGVLYDAEVVLCFSEIDPALHQAVATGNYGPGKPMTSTIDYNPKYFLVNGQPYAQGKLPLPAGQPNQRILIRFLNAGLETHVPVLHNLYMSVVAEDGNKYNYASQQYSVVLPALKTKDAVMVPSAPGTYPLYDRRLRLTNNTESSGGMMAFLSVANP